MQPCTSFSVPKAPRGGKGADKRFAAYDAEIARITALRCGASSYSITRVTAVTQHVAAVSVFEGARCLGATGRSEGEMWVVDQTARAARFNRPCL
jgi:hypothetical protein